jgi:hypothetical protein
MPLAIISGGMKGASMTMLPVRRANGSFLHILRASATISE